MTALRGRGAREGLCSVVNVPGGGGGVVLPSIPAPHCSPSDASFPQHCWGPQLQGPGRWRGLAAVLPLPGPKGPPGGGSPGRVQWVGVGYLLPMG